MVEYFRDELRTPEAKQKILTKKFFDSQFTQLAKKIVAYRIKDDTAKRLNYEYAVAHNHPLSTIPLCMGEWKKSAKDAKIILDIAVKVVKDNLVKAKDVINLCKMLHEGPLTPPRRV